MARRVIRNGKGRDGAAILPQENMKRKEMNGRKDRSLQPPNGEKPAGAGFIPGMYCIPGAFLLKWGIRNGDYPSRQNQNETGHPC